MAGIILLFSATEDISSSLFFHFSPSERKNAVNQRVFKILSTFNIDTRGHKKTQKRQNIDGGPEDPPG